MFVFYSYFISVFFYFLFFIFYFLFFYFFIFVLLMMSVCFFENWIRNFSLNYNKNFVICPFLMWLNIRRAPVTGEHSKRGSKFNLISVNKSKSVTSNQSFSWKKIVVFLVFVRRVLEKNFFYPMHWQFAYVLSVRINKCLKIC